MAQPIEYYLAHPDEPCITLTAQGRTITAPSMRERFAAGVQPGEPEVCWEWRGSRTNWNYGRIRISNQSVGAHRVSFVLAGGDLLAPSVLHHCDNPPCVNPAHLFNGTNGDNVRDMMAKGRGWQQNKTHCQYGHEFATQNVIWKPNGSYQCRLCHNRVQAGYQRSRRKR